MFYISYKIIFSIFFILQKENTFFIKKRKRNQQHGIKIDIPV